MEQRGLRQADLVPVLGSRAQVSDLVNGKRRISKAQAKKLAEYIGLSAKFSFSNGAPRKTASCVADPNTYRNDAESAELGFSFLLDKTVGAFPIIGEGGRIGSRWRACFPGHAGKGLAV